MPAYRKAALSIYSLHKKDQEWLLARVSSQHRAALKALLKELKTLGIPRHGIMPRSIQESEPDIQLLLPEQEIQLLDNASETEIFQLLGQEPESVVAVILSLYRWQWSTALRRRFSPAKQKTIARYVKTARRNGYSMDLGRAILASLNRMLQDARQHENERNADTRVVTYSTRGGMWHRAWRALWPA